MSSVVYFIQVKPSGPIKIGYTTSNVFIRTQALQFASPYELEWIGFFYGGKADEAAAHKLLAASRCRNEWFFPTFEVLNFIRDKCPSFNAIAARDFLLRERERAVVARYVRNKGGGTFGRAWEIAAAAKTDVCTIQKWLSREHMISDEIVARAHDAARAAILSEIAE